MVTSERARIHSYLLVSRDSQSQQVIVWDTARIRIGRHHEQDIVLDNPEVSREHALLRRDGDRYIVEDLGTANGTFVNGKPVRKVELTPNEAIKIGDCSFRFCQSSDHPADTLPNVTLASRLRGALPNADDASGSTMLGLPGDDDSLWNAGSRPGGQPTPQPVVRDLDWELASADNPEKEDVLEIGHPDDPDPLMASAFDLGAPLPPVGRSLPALPEAPQTSSGAQSEPTAPTFLNPSAAPEKRSVEIILQLDGVDPELLRTLQGLLGQRFDLSTLSLFLKALSIR
jgi:predicted component of type VI protein secretion system